MKKQMLSILEGNKTNLSSRQFVGRDLPHPLLLGQEEKQPCFTRGVEDPRQRPSGMTTFFNNDNGKIGRCRITAFRQNSFYYNRHGGFTLIELLVVVLIIGILAAVAVPQYKFAVAKARMTELVTLSSAVKQAQDRYFLANGTWATKWDELDIDLTGYTVAGGNILYKRNAYDINNYMHATLYVEKKALYFSGGNKDLPGILFITWFSTGAQYCYANKDNDLAKKLCKNVCKSKTLATDGSWRGCTL